jgi:hypothetical protein
MISKPVTQTFMLFMFRVVLLMLHPNSVRAGDKHDKAKSETVLPLCDILRSPDVYEGQHVIVSATYRVDYEHSELYCLSCFDKPVWVEFDFEQGAEHAAKMITRLVHTQGTVNGIFSGTFHAQGGYGHLAAYKHKLSVGSVRSLKLVDRLGLPAANLRQESRSKVCK